MNDIYVALPFAQFLISAVLVIVVFLSAPRASVNRLFAAFLVAIAFWGFAIFGLRDAFPDAGRGLVFENIVLAIVPFSSVFFYHFVVRFIGAGYSSKLVGFFYTFASVSGLFSLLGWSASGLTMKFYGFAPELGWAFPIMLAAAYPPVVLAFIRLTSARKLTGDHGQIAALSLMRWGVIASVIGGTSDFIPSLGVQIYPMGVLGNIAFGVLTTVAVTRYQMMDLRLVLRRGLVHGIVSSGMLAVYGVALLAVWLIVKHFSDTAMIMALIGTVLITGLAAQPLVQRLQSVVDRLFFRERLDRLDTIFSLSAQLRDARDLTAVLERLSVGVRGAVQPDWITVLLPNRDGDQFRMALDSRGEVADVTLPRNGGITRWFAANKTPLSTAVLETDPMLQALVHEEKVAIYSVNSNLMVPIVTQDEVTGIIALGPKIVDGDYSAADIDFITAVADHSAVAIENARLYSEEVERRAEVERLDLMKSNLLRTVSHELKSPITAIKISTELLETVLESEPSDSHAGRMIRTLKNGTARLERLTQEALDYATMQSANLELQLEKSEIEKVVRDVISLVPATESRNQTLDLNLDAALGSTSMDVRRVERILLNLVTNASKYTPDGGKISISTIAQAGCHVVQVTDNGKGIPASDHEMIFSPCFRSQVPDSSPVAGSGLGLSIARFLAEQHGGSLTVSSVVGKGSTFTLALPIEGPESTTVEFDGVMGAEKPSRRPEIDSAPVNRDQIATHKPAGSSAQPPTLQPQFSVGKVDPR